MLVGNPPTQREIESICISTDDGSRHCFHHEHNSFIALPTCCALQGRKRHGDQTTQNTTHPASILADHGPVHPPTALSVPSASYARPSASDSPLARTLVAVAQRAASGRSATPVQVEPQTRTGAQKLTASPPVSHGSLHSASRIMPRGPRRLGQLHVSVPASRDRVTLRISKQERAECLRTEARESCGAVLFK